MNTSTPRLSPALLASTLLIAASAMLAGCGPIATSANAQAPAPTNALTGAVAFGDVMYFGEEFATEEKTLVADNKPQAPTF